MDPRFGLQLLISEVPSLWEFRFQCRNGLYWAEKNGVVRFFSWHGPGQNGGFGGRSYDIIMQDETRVELLGPWSSRAGCMNAAGFPHCIEAGITDDLHTWSGESRHLTHAAVLVEFAHQKIPLVQEIRSGARMSMPDEPIYRLDTQS
jgi:hypothetical protein